MKNKKDTERMAPLREDNLESDSAGDVRRWITTIISLSALIISIIKSI